jgi:uncharacterized protein YchJ
MRIVLFVTFVACAAMPRTGEVLGDTVREYNEHVKWERFDRASTFVPNAQRAARVDEWDERAHDLKITGVDIVKIDRRGDREARVQIKLEWYRASENTVHETQAVQTWERHGKDWLVVDEARLRGPEMPGLPEPLMRDDKH